MDYGPYNSQSRNELNESSHQLIKSELNNERFEFISNLLV